MLPRSLSKPTWCPKSTIATACCTASQINYWIVFSEFRTMLPGWSSGCTNSAISLTPALATLHWLPVNHQIDFKIALLVYKALNGQPQPISQIFCSPMIHPEAALGWQATPFTATLSFEIIWWSRVLLCSPSCVEQYPSQCEDRQDCW